MPSTAQPMAYVTVGVIKPGNNRTFECRAMANGEFVIGQIEPTGGFDIIDTFGNRSTALDYLWFEARQSSPEWRDVPPRWLYQPRRDDNELAESAA